MSTEKALDRTERDWIHVRPGKLTRWLRFTRASRCRCCVPPITSSQALFGWLKNFNTFIGPIIRLSLTQPSIHPSMQHLPRYKCTTITTRHILRQFTNSIARLIIDYPWHCRPVATLLHSFFGSDCRDQVELISIINFSWTQVTHLCLAELVWMLQVKKNCDWPDQLKHNLACV